MSDKFLITRPQHDDTVTYFYHWCNGIIKAANEKGVNFSDFKGKRANRAGVEKFLKKQNPDFVMFNGHGSASTICGHKDEPLIISNENDILLKGRITYSISCASAKELGKTAVKKGGTAFIGFNEDFCFVRDAQSECSPDRDRFAEPFRLTSSRISISLLEGRNIKEACNEFRQLSVNLIRKYASSDAEPGNKEIRFWLFWNLWHLRAHGNEEAKFILT